MNAIIEVKDVLIFYLNISPLKTFRKFHMNELYLTQNLIERNYILWCA